MNAKTLVPLVIAVVLGVIAAKLGRDMVLKRRAEEARVKMVRVVLATADLPPGSVLQEEHLAIGSIPEESSAPGISRYAFSKPSELIGRVVLTQVVKGQPVLETLLAPRGSGGGAQAMIPQGMRAVTLEVNEYNGVAGLLVPGCQVDVVHTLKLRDDQGGDGGLMTRTLVENLRVLAVGRRTSAAAASKGPEPEQPARSVTVLVTQAQAELIDLVTHIGQPRLVLRNGLDQRTGGGKGVTLAELRGDSHASAPKNDPLAGFVRTLLATNTPATRPADPESYKPAPEQSAGASNWRNVEVIRAGTSSTVRVSAPAEPAFTGGDDKLEGAYPGSEGYDD